MNIKARFKTVIWTQRTVASFVLVVLIFLSTVGPIAAQTVLQGYKSDEQLQKGMLVALKKDDQSKIEAINDTNLDNLKGVVADANDSPVTLSGDGKIFVATSGSYEVLVSNENGKIAQGDYISASTLAGIGAKAGEVQGTILGRAVGKFDGEGDAIGKSKAKDSDKTVAFGRIQVDIGVGKNPLLKNPEKDKVPDALQKVANTVADKPVNTLRIYLALVVLVVTAAVAATTLFSGVRSTVISIGRNPLSKGIILKGLVQVLLISLIIFITGLFGVYLLIKL